MLVLSRKLGQRIVITTPEGREVFVSVEKIGLDTVRIGIDAEREVSVHREEIAQQIEAERRLGNNGRNQ
jgi:carbon storage regulator